MPTQRYKQIYFRDQVDGDNNNNYIVLTVPDYYYFQQGEDLTFWIHSGSQNEDYEDRNYIIDITDISFKDANDRTLRLETSDPFGELIDSTEYVQRNTLVNIPDQDDTYNEWINRNDLDLSYAQVWQAYRWDKQYLLENYQIPPFQKIVVSFTVAQSFPYREIGSTTVEIERDQTDRRFEGLFNYGQGGLGTDWGIEVLPENPISRENNQINITITPPQWDQYWWAYERPSNDYSRNVLSVYMSPLNILQNPVVYEASLDSIKNNREPINLVYNINEEILENWPFINGSFNFNIRPVNWSTTIDSTSRLFNFETTISDYVIDFWETEYTLTADRTNVFEFRKDIRNALQDVLDSTIRQEVIANWERIYDNEGLSALDWEPLGLQNSERARLINAWVTELLYNVESIFNFFGESQVQALYASIYSHLERLRNNLKNFIDTTVQTTEDNLLRLEELVNVLQQKVDHETLMNYEISLPSVPLNQIKAFLYKTNSRLSWNITENIRNLNGQLIIDFGNLAETVGHSFDNPSPFNGYFQSWFIRIMPNYSAISTYIASNDNILSAVIQESDVNILGSTIFDANGKVYKIVNKDGDNRWILTEPINQDVRDQPLTIMFNYFEPQTLELKFAWKHNYIPKAIPLGIALPNYDITQEEIIVTPPPVPPETVERGQIPETNREIF